MLDHRSGSRHADAATATGPHIDRGGRFLDGRQLASPRARPWTPAQRPNGRVRLVALSAVCTALLAVGDPHPVAAPGRCPRCRQDPGAPIPSPRFGASDRRTLSFYLRQRAALRPISGWSPSRQPAVPARPSRSCPAPRRSAFAVRRWPVLLDRLPSLRGGDRLAAQTFSPTASDSRGPERAAPGVTSCRPGLQAPDGAAVYAQFSQVRVLRDTRGMRAPLGLPPRGRICPASSSAPDPRSLPLDDLRPGTGRIMHGA